MNHIYLDKARSSEASRFSITKIWYAYLLTIILEVLLKDTVNQKESFPSKESDTKLLQSIYFAYEVGIISSYSNRTCY